MADQHILTGKIVKVDKRLGLVFGYAMNVLKDGETYYDLHNDHVDDDELLKSALDFAENSEVAREMHGSVDKGAVVFTFPLTTDIAKAFDIETVHTGLMIGMRPTADVLDKFADGTYKGFSIGGKARRVEVTADR